MTTDTIAKPQGPVMRFSTHVGRSRAIQLLLAFGQKVVAEQSGLRRALRLFSEVAIIPTAVILFYQLSDVAKSDEVTTYNYITHYETEFLHKEPWRHINELSEEITNEIKNEPGSKFGDLAAVSEQDVDEFFATYDEKFVEKIEQTGDLKASLDQFAAHFRAVLYCVEEERCDEEIVKNYYASPMCHLKQKALGYIEKQYASRNWDKHRGNLLDFYEKHDCKSLVASVVWGKD